MTESHSLTHSLMFDRNRERASWRQKAFSIGAIEKRETQDEKAPSRETQNENSAFSIGAPHGVPSAPSLCIHNEFVITLLLLLSCGVSQFRSSVSLSVAAVCDLHMRLGRTCYARNNRVL